MTDSSKSALDQALANLETFAKNSPPDLQLGLRQIMNEPDPAKMASKINIFKLTYPQFPDSFFQNLLSAVSVKTQQNPQVPATDENGAKIQGGGGLAATALALPFIRTASMQRRAQAKLRLNKALRREAIRQASDDRSSEAYKLSEDYVFKKWCKQARIKDQNSNEAQNLRKNEQFKDDVGEHFVKKNKLQETIKEKTSLERKRAYDNPEDDPAIKELNKMLSELNAEHNRKSEKQKKKDPQNKKAKNDVLSVFAKEFPEKTDRYTKWQKKRDYEIFTKGGEPMLAGLSSTMSSLRGLSDFMNTPDYNDEGVPPISPQATNSHGGQGIRNLAQKGVNKALKKGLEEPAEQLAEQGLKQGALQLARAAGSAVLSALGAIGWPVLVAAAIILIIIILCLILTGGGGNGNGTEDNNSTLLLSKTVTPAEVPNLDQTTPAASQFTYTITADYLGQGGQMVIEDPIPDNADFVSADNNAALMDASGNATTDASLVRSVVWTVDEGTGSGGLLETENQLQATSQGNVFHLTLQPKPEAKDTYIINQATGEVIGGSGPTASISGQSETITLDPGHPANTQDGLVNCGNTGAGVPGNPNAERDLNFEIATLLESKLESAGYNVIMTKSNVDQCVSNHDRANIANQNNSVLFFRIHADGAGAGPRGYFMMTPDITCKSTALPTQDSIQKGTNAAQSIVSALRSANLSIPANSNTFRADSSGGNAGDNPSCPGLLTGSSYSKVPVTLIETGNLDNSSDLAWFFTNAGQKDEKFNETNLNVFTDALAKGIENFAPITNQGQSASGATTQFVGTSGSTPIQGVWGGTANTLVNLFNGHTPKFTVPVSQLAQYYINYSAQAGLRADILWAQMIHETGWGNYGGDVNPNQNNFAGLGAVGGGAAGASFNTAEDGVEAQIAHMYAYVHSDNNLSFITKDPRYNLVNPRGQVKTLHDLDGRWAVPGTNYGETIEGIIKQLNP